MLSERQAAEIENSAWFQTRWAPYALIDADLRIRALNAAFERASAHPRDAMIGRPLFEVFPDNPADLEADGVANLADSLEKTFRRGAQHWMGVQRYDVPDRQRPGEFHYRVWMPVNSPIRDGRKTVAALHHSQDISRVVPPAASRRRFPGTAELQNTAASLGRQFPGLPAEVVLGVLTHSHSVVMETLGVPDLEQAGHLARLRLEARAGHPALES